MADFTKSFNRTAKNEGGYVNDPVDRGGETWKGIARKFWPNWDGWDIIDFHKKDPKFPSLLNAHEKLELSLRKFFKKEFWDVIRGDEILMQPMADSIYDSAVNMGTRTAIKLAQRTKGISETGRLDNYTLDRLNNKA